MGTVAGHVKPILIVNVSYGIALLNKFLQTGSVNKAHFVTQPNLLITPHN